MISPAREETPLLQGRQDHQDEHSRNVVYFDKWDEDDPRNWPRTRKLINVTIVAWMAVMSPLASSMFTPGMNQIAEDLKVEPAVVIGATTGFLISLGIGPLILAPMSETFGRRKIYLVSFTLFSLLQIPAALSPNIQTLLVARAVSGFVGSSGIANGGGSISDMFHPSERAGVYGWYLLGPVVGPTLGPVFGGLVVERLGWRWVFWILAILCTANTVLAFIFLHETYAPAILKARRDHLEKETGNKYRIQNEDERPLGTKLASSMKRPIRILFTQPIVLILAIYQATLFGTNYSLYTNFQAIYGDLYGFSPTQVGLVFLAPGLGYLLALSFIIPRIDTVYNALTARNKGIAKPEFRLPLTNIGSVFVAISLFWLAWTVEYRVHWLLTTVSITFFGFGQITVSNTVQNYYIDSFSAYAASAIAAGALFRSLVGGFVPLGAPHLFENIGYGWGISAFAFLNLTLAPFPLLFYFVGERLRKRFAIEL